MAKSPAGMPINSVHDIAKFTTYWSQGAVQGSRAYSRFETDALAKLDFKSFEKLLGDLAGALEKVTQNTLAVQSDPGYSKQAAESKKMLENILNTIDKVKDATRAEMKYNTSLNNIRVLRHKLDSDEEKRRIESLRTQKKLREEIDELEKRRIIEQDENEKKKLDKELNKKTRQYADLQAGGIPHELKQALDGITRSLDGLLKTVDNSAEWFATNLGPLQSRLNGSGKNVESIATTLAANLSSSSTIKINDVLSNIVKLTSQGATYNLEERATLAAVSEKISSTFDIMSPYLLRLARLTGEDTSYAALGASATLTELLNSQFLDTQYLTRLSPSVTNAIVDAASLSDDSTGFIYAVEKWLGSLYEVGLSESSISSIANAIGLLGTGNVSALSGNTSLSNLLVASSANANLDYANLLTGGLSTSDVNTLLKSMVEYLRDISESTSNNVVSSEFARVFGLTRTDMSALRSMDTSRIATIAGSAPMTGDFTGKLTSMLTDEEYLNSVYHASELIDNVLNNLSSNVGFQTAGNNSAYLGYRFAKLGGELSSMVGDNILGDALSIASSIGTLASMIGGIKSSASELFDQWEWNKPFTSVFGPEVDLDLFSAYLTDSAQRLSSGEKTSDVYKKISTPINDISTAGVQTSNQVFNEQLYTSQETLSVAGGISETLSDIVKKLESVIVMDSINVSGSVEVSNSGLFGSKYGTD